MISISYRDRPRVRVPQRLPLSHLQRPQLLQFPDRLDRLWLQLQLRRYRMDRLRLHRSGVEDLCWILQKKKKATASASQLSTEHATLMTEVPQLLVLLHDCNLTDAKLKKDWKASLSKQLKNLDTMERKLVKHSDKLEQAKSQDAIAQCIWIYIYIR